MKRFVKYISVLAVAASFCACQEKEADWYVKSEDKILEVVKADVTFSPEQSTGAIELNTNEAITATSSESWCSVSVSGNTVNVTVEAYEGLEGRNATIEIKTATKAVTVPVHQGGRTLIIGGEKAYLFSAVGGNMTVPVRSNYSVAPTSDVDWLTFEAVEGGFKVIVAANTGASFRKGNLIIDNKKILLRQVGTNGPIGTYTAYFKDYNQNNQLSNYYIQNVEIVAGSAANTYTIKHFFETSEKDYPITLKYNASTNDYYIDNAFNMGTMVSEGTTYTLRCMAEYYTSATATTPSVYTSTTASATSAYRMSFGFSMDDNNDVSFVYRKNSNMSASYTTPGFAVYAYKSATSVSAANRVSAVGHFWELRLVPSSEL